MRNWILSRLRKHREDESGVISLEFILVMPLLALWFIGSFVFFDAYRSASQTEKVAFTVADIMSRYDAVGTTELDELWALQGKMLPPRSTQHKLRITSICFNQGFYRVMWSYTNADTGITMNPMMDIDIPLGIMPVMAEQDSIILTEVSAKWIPLSTKVGVKEQSWDNALVVRPRYVQKIPHATINTDVICPASDEPGVGGEAPINGDGTTG